MSINTGKYPQQHLVYPGYYRNHMGEVLKKVASLLGEHEEEIQEKMRRILHDSFNVPIESVSAKEIQDLYILFSYLLRRTIHGEVQFRGLNKPGSKPNLSSAGKNLVWHDLGHSIARYMLDPTNQSKDPGRFTPTPFKYRYRGYTEHYDTLVEELHVSIWMISGIGKGGSLLPLRLMKKDPTIDSGTALYNAYMRYNLGKIDAFSFQEPFYGILFEMCSLGFVRLTHLEKRKENIKEIRSRITKSDFPKIRELMTYIYEHRGNPRVLLNLFFLEMQPLIDQIKKRKEFQS